MSWIDVAILALVVLMGLIGVWRGIKKSALSLAIFLISFLLAFFLANVIAEAFLGIDSVKEFVLGDGMGKGSQWSLAKWIYNGVDITRVDGKSFLGKNFYKPMVDIVTSTTTAAPDPNAGFALYGAFMIFSAICGVGIFIVVRLLLIVMSVIVKSYIGKKKSIMGRLFGFLVNAIRGALWVFAFTIVFSCFGGYSFVGGIKSIEAEYENNAVVCGYFNEWAYGLRNKLLLPDKDTYGRLVDMVYKKQVTEDPNAEKLAPDRLKLFVSVSNLNYDGARWSVDEKTKKRKEDKSVSERTAAEFKATGFDTVAQAILDYNKSIADLIDDTTKLNDIAEQFTTLDGVVANIEPLMNNLWTALRKYNTDCTTAPNKEQDNWESTLNSTLAGDYNAITGAIDELKAKYDPFVAKFGAFPEYELPARVEAADVPVRPTQPEGPGEDGPGEDGPGEDGPGEDGPGEDGPGEDGPGEDGPGEDGPGEDGPGEDGPGEDGPGEDGPGEDGPGEDGPGEDGPGEDGPGEDGPGEDGPGEDGPGGEGEDPPSGGEDETVDE